MQQNDRSRMAKMKPLAMLLLSLCVVQTVHAERVFSEDVLEGWGYKTTAVDEKGQHVRSLKNYGDSNEALYARFSINTSSFASEAEAAAEMQNIERKRESTVLGRDKDYRRILQKGKVLYFVAATSNYTRLQH